MIHIETLIVKENIGNICGYYNHKNASYCHFCNFKSKMGAFLKEIKKTSSQMKLQRNMPDKLAE